MRLDVKSDGNEVSMRSALFDDEGGQGSSWVSVIARNRALCILTHSKCTISERSIFFDGAFASGISQ